MLARLLVLVAALAALALPPAARAQEAASAPSSGVARAPIVYLGIEGDAHYDPQPVYTGLSLKDPHRPLDGARLGMRDTRVLGRALKVDFALDERLVAPGAVADAVRAAAQDGALAVLLDLPPDAMAEAIAAAAGQGVLINLRDPDGRWRGADCAPGLLHTVPSDAMLSDALAQYLRAQDWGTVLLLHGDAPRDAALAEAARASARKFGLKITADRGFTLTNDPRQRDQSNIRLLTGGARYDVVWLVDSAGEFGRYVPYATYLPRPVVGTEGLRPRTWDWTFERYGAPQLNQRFRRLADRDMGPEDWAGWAAVQAVVNAVRAAGSADPGAVRGALTGDDLRIDLYKGVPGSFRPWDGQLRQPVLLATHDAVIDVAPLPGFEHRTDTLDTLGVDAGETACRR